MTAHSVRDSRPRKPPSAAGPVPVPPPDDDGPVPIAGEPRPRIQPGEYPAACVAAKIERHRVFRRWTGVLRFAILDADGAKTGIELAAYLNLGVGEVPNPTPTGRYYAAWCTAAGRKPSRREAMTPAVFRERLFRVRVADVGAGPSAYSKVSALLERLA